MIVTEKSIEIKLRATLLRIFALNALGRDFLKLLKRDRSQLIVLIPQRVCLLARKMLFCPFESIIPLSAGIVIHPAWIFKYQSWSEEILDETEINVDAGANE